MDRSCTSCKTTEKPKVIERSSWLSAFLVIIIPKCPFCVMAYTSAITMCGGTDMYFAENNWVSYIPILLGAIIILLADVLSKSVLSDTVGLFYEKNPLEGVELPIGMITSMLGAPFFLLLLFQSKKKRLW